MWTVAVLRKKPPSGSCVRNVREWDCGGLNVDKSRIRNRGKRGDPRGADGRVYRPTGNVYGTHRDSSSFDLNQGRWPANLLLLQASGCSPFVGCGDGCPVLDLDRQSGRTSSVVVVAGCKKPFSSSRTWNTGGRALRGGQPNAPRQYGDEGGASRFFKQFKAL